MNEAIVSTTKGKVKGKKEGTYTVWKGIPYAKPPVNELRFKAPVPMEEWDSVLDTTHFGPNALQNRNEVMDFLAESELSNSEDCLYLNIYSPNNIDTLKPVLFWIHGGAFINGSGSDYDGSSFAANGDVVVVTFNYRLNIFGFLHLGEINREFEDSGNCGILDQMAALKWVNENISAFGGDPNNITIFGESAGAMSVATLLAAPEAKGYFHKAILQSGAGRNTITSDRATRVARNLLEHLHIKENELEKITSISTEELLEASKHAPFMELAPVIDGKHLPITPEEAIKRGNVKDIPIMIGTNRDEIQLFTLFDKRWKFPTVENMNSILKEIFGKPKPVLSCLSMIRPAFLKKWYVKLATWAVFTYPAIRLAELQSPYNQVWMYRFDRESQRHKELKAGHAIEIEYVWNSVGEFTNEDQVLADKMHKSWVQFAYNGNPNHELIPNWNPYDSNNRNTIIFNVVCEVQSDPDVRMRKIFEKRKSTM